MRRQSPMPEDFLYPCDEGGTFSPPPEIRAFNLDAVIKRIADIFEKLAAGCFVGALLQRDYIGAVLGTVFLIICLLITGLRKWTN